MRRKELNPIHLEIACGVCDRTMLKGEHPGSYLAPAAGRYPVCALCAPRAEGAGWIREVDSPAVGAAHPTPPEPHATARHGHGRGRPPAAAPAAPRTRPEPRRSLLARVLAWLGEEPPDPVARPEPPEAPAEAEGHDKTHGHGGAHGPGEGPPRRRRPAPDAADHGPRRRGEGPHVRAAPGPADVKVERALEIFNASDHRRRVAGIARSLGEPWVSATPSGTASSEILVVVAWELCWYRFRVDLADRVEPVRVLDRGEELHQLGTTALWNGAAAPDGRLLSAAR